MEKALLLASLGLVLAGVAFPSMADTLQLKNGSVVEGKYAGGTATTLSIETAQGLLAVATADVVALKFAEPPAPVVVVPAPAPVSAAPPAPSPAEAPRLITVPAGTVLTVRMDSQVSSSDAPGMKFSGTLLADLTGGGVVIKAGTTVLGQVQQAKQAGRLAGKADLQLALVSINMSGKLVPILTTNFAETGSGSFKKTARNATTGALIGNAIDNDGGAGKGAAVGVGASLIRRGDSVTVPPGAILEFRLVQPLTVTAAP